MSRALCVLALAACTSESPSPPTFLARDGLLNGLANGPGIYHDGYEAIARRECDLVAGVLFDRGDLRAPWPAGTARQLENHIACSDLIVYGTRVLSALDERLDVYEETPDGPQLVLSVDGVLGLELEVRFGLPTYSWLEHGFTQKAARIWFSYAAGPLTNPGIHRRVAFVTGDPGLDAYLEAEDRTAPRELTVAVPEPADTVAMVANPARANEHPDFFRACRGRRIAQGVTATLAAPDGDHCIIPRAKLAYRPPHHVYLWTPGRACRLAGDEVLNPDEQNCPIAVLDESDEQAFHPRAEGCEYGSALLGAPGGCVSSWGRPGGEARPFRGFAYRIRAGAPGFTVDASIPWQW